MFNKSSLAMSQRQSWASQARVTIWGLSRKLWAQPLQQPGSRRSKFTQMIQLEIDFATFHLRCSLIYLSWEAFNCFAIRATCRWNADMKSLSTTKRMSWNVSWLLNVCILYWWSCILDDRAACISQDVFRMQQKLAVLGLNLKEGKDLVFLQSNEGFCIIILYGFKQLCSNLQKTLRQGDSRSRKTKGGLCFDMLRLCLSFDVWCQYLVLLRHNPTLEFRRVEETFGNSACGGFVDGWVAMSPVSRSGPLTASIGSAVPLIIRL